MGRATTTWRRTSRREASSECAAFARPLARSHRRARGSGRRALSRRHLRRGRLYERDRGARRARARFRRRSRRDAVFLRDCGGNAGAREFRRTRCRTRRARHRADRRCGLRRRRVVDAVRRARARVFDSSGRAARHAHERRRGIQRLRSAARCRRTKPRRLDLPIRRGTRFAAHRAGHRGRARTRRIAGAHRGLRDARRTSFGRARSLAHPSRDPHLSSLAHRRQRRTRVVAARTRRRGRTHASRRPDRCRHLS